MSQTIDAEVVTPENPMAIAVRHAQPVGLFGTSEPAAVIEKAAAVANALKGVIVRQGLVSKISGKEYPRCEAWTLLGTMLGVFPVTVWTKEVEGGWEARVEARTKDGSVIGAAEAQCLRAERNWANRDDFALRSMAQTRATAKCLRMPLGFVMTLAGFEATPAEEMVTDHPKGNFQSNNRTETGVGRVGTSHPVSSHPPKPQAGGPPAKPPPQNKSAAPDKRYATLKTREWLIKRLAPMRDLATEYFRKLANPVVLMPNENLEDLGLQFLPLDLGQTKLLEAAITDFGNGAQVRHAYPPNELKPIDPPKQQVRPAPTSPPTTTTPPTPPVARSPAQAPPPANKRDPEWFFDIICPVPPKGVKKADYIKAPDTIRSLYTRMKEGDTEGAGKRLWGFANHYEAKPWVGSDGQTRQPTNADLVFRDALDAFLEWEEKHGEDTLTDGQLADPQNMPSEDPAPGGPELEEDMDVPF